MTKPTPQKITQWSYSRYACYRTCPAQAKYKHIDKLPDPGSPAMERGIAIHKLAEDYATGRLKALPDELAKFKAEFADLKKRDPLCEQEWAFTDKWEPTGWLDKDAWVRIKTDAAYTLKGEGHVIDHKTGRVRLGEYAEQMELYALAGLLMFKDIRQVHTRLWFLDHGEQDTAMFVRKDIDALKRKWAARTKFMLADTRFAAKPGNQCRWCPYSASKGGPCHF
jgi:hypothetical protein